MFFPKDRKCITVDQPVKRCIQTAAFDKLRHVERRIVPPFGAQRILQHIVKFAEADLAVTHLGNMAAAKSAKAARTGDIAQRKGKTHQDDKGKRDRCTPARGQHSAEGTDHVCPDILVKAETATL